MPLTLKMAVAFTCRSAATFCYGCAIRVRVTLFRVISGTILIIIISNSLHVQIGVTFRFCNFGIFMDFYTTFQLKLTLVPENFCKGLFFTLCLEPCCTTISITVFCYIQSSQLLNIHKLFEYSICLHLVIKRYLISLEIIS